MSKNWHVDGQGDFQFLIEYSKRKCLHNCGTSSSDVTKPDIALAVNELNFKDIKTNSSISRTNVNISRNYLANNAKIHMSLLKKESQDIFSGRVTTLTFSVWDRVNLDC